MSEAITDAAEATDDPSLAFAQMLAPASRFWKADGDRGFVIVNLESPVAKKRVNSVDRNLERRARSSHRGASAKAIRLNMPRWVLRGLRKAGVHAVTLANNHAFDQEAQGLLDTIEAAREEGLVVLGAGRIPQRRWTAVVGESNIAVLNVFDARRKESPQNKGELAISMMSDDFVNELKRTAKDHKRVIVIVHVLGELVSTPKIAWQQWARSLANAGASWIVVHGTHVPLRLDHIITTDGHQVPIAWGLGNFFSDMSRLSSPRRKSSASDKASFANVRESYMLRLSEGPHQQLQASALPLFLADDRFVQWHANRGRKARVKRNIRFSLVPLPTCGDYHTPAAWDLSHGPEWSRWVTKRRDHLIGVMGERLNPNNQCIVQSIPVQ